MKILLLTRTWTFSLLVSSFFQITGSDGRKNGNFFWKIDFFQNFNFLPKFQIFVNISNFCPNFNFLKISIFDKITNLFSKFQMIVKISNFCQNSKLFFCNSEKWNLNIQLKWIGKLIFSICLQITNFPKIQSFVKNPFFCLIWNFCLTSKVLSKIHFLSNLKFLFNFKFFVKKIQIFLKNLKFLTRVSGRPLCIDFWSIFPFKFFRFWIRNESLWQCWRGHESKILRFNKILSPRGDFKWAISGDAGWSLDNWNCSFHTFSWWKSILWFARNYERKITNWHAVSLKHFSIKITYTGAYIRMGDTFLGG